MLLSPDPLRRSRRVGRLALVALILPLILITSALRIWFRWRDRQRR